MSLLFLAEAYGAYCLVAALASVLVILVAIHRALDGSPLQSALDDSDRRRLVAAHEGQPLGLFAAELDAIQALPEFEPWKRYLP